MIKIAYIGAGSIQFGPIIVQDILLSDKLCENGIEIYLISFLLLIIGLIFGRFTILKLEKIFTIDY